MPTDMAGIREMFRAAVQALAEHQHEMQGDSPHLAGEIATDVVTPAPGEMLVIRLPAHTDAHIIADVTRFVETQAAATGMQLPILVTPASESVTTEPGG